MIIRSFRLAWSIQQWTDSTFTRAEETWNHQLAGNFTHTWGRCFRAKTPVTQWGIVCDIYHCFVLPISHVRYINILTWLWGFQVKLLYLVLFSLYLSLFWELRDKRNLKNLQFWPESLGTMLEYWYIERGLLQIALKRQENYSKEEKRFTKSEKLLEGLKVAPNLKSCSKVAEQLMDSPKKNTN